jgi:transposase InsO family protein
MGPEALEERSRNPSHPNQTPEHIVQAILEMRRRHPSWGAKKLLPRLEKRHPRWDLPSRTTVSDILSRHGMVPKKRNRRAVGHPGKPSSAILAPNDVWAADFKGHFKTFKGHFKTGNGRYCYPLTVTDGFSRFLLACQGLHSTSVSEAKPVFTRLFKEYGLPKRIRTDNGVPFASRSELRARVQLHFHFPGGLLSDQRGKSFHRLALRVIRPMLDAQPQDVVFSPAFLCLARGSGHGCGQREQRDQCGRRFSCHCSSLQRCPTLRHPQPADAVMPPCICRTLSRRIPLRHPVPWGKCTLPARAGPGARRAHPPGRESPRGTSCSEWT